MRAKASISRLTFNGKQLEFEDGSTILLVARKNEIYIPTLCFHPDLPPAEECGLCIVEVEGRGQVPACTAIAEPGAVIQSDTEELIAARRARLSEILEDHPHACLTCAQAEGCSRTQCSTGVPEEERCCSEFGNCELQQVADYIGILPETPRYIPAGLPRPDVDPLFVRDPNLCINCARCLRVCRDVRGVDILERTTINNRTVVSTKDGASLSDSQCRFCGACVDVCPTGALLDKTRDGGNRAERLVPCVNACPAEVEVPGYLRLVARGEFDDALTLILSRVPLPGVLGWICPAPCESVCRRTDLGGAAAICAVKRVCTEQGQGQLPEPRDPPSGKHVAVVGAGPAGLAATAELRRLGHWVTLIDEQERPGGILRSAIPPFRLPREVIDRDVERIIKLGVDFHPATRVGRDLQVTQLLSEHDAVLLAVGAQLARQLELEPPNLPGLYLGLDFLRDALAGRGPSFTGRVLVIGSGSVAIDCATVALRLGAAAAVLCTLESPEELPAHPADLQAALEEGVELLPFWGPKRLLERDGRVAGLELVRCNSVLDSQGRFAPKYDDSELKEIAGVAVILAIGQAVDREVLAGLTELEGGAGPLPGRDSNFETGIPGLFACGDALATTSTIIEAISSGRQAALTVDLHLGGSGAELPKLASARGDQQLVKLNRFAERRRMAQPRDPAGPHRLDWDAQAEPLSREAAIDEAARCLQCDLRLTISAPHTPPQLLQELAPDLIGKVPEAAGVYMLYDKEQQLFAISGVQNLRDALVDKLESDRAAFFEYELNELYTARESELLQQYLAQNGKLLSGEDDLDELF